MLNVISVVTGIKNLIHRLQRVLKVLCEKILIGKIFLPFDIIETDHIIPMAKKGSHKITNLQVLNAVCHDRKI